MHRASHHVACLFQGRYFGMDFTLMSGRLTSVELENMTVKVD